MASLEPSLSPRQLAIALGVSESSVKRWVDAGRLRARRTRGGHRRIERLEALRFARELGSTLAEPRLLGLELGELPSDPRALQQQLAEWLAAGAAERFVSGILGLYVGGHAVPLLFDQFLAPALNGIGEYFGERDDAVFIEHRATEICAQAVHRLGSALSEPAEGAVALGGGIAGDPYILPSLCAATSLRAEGFRTVNLGANVPLEAFEAAIDRHGPSLVWLSVSSEMGLVGSESQLAGLSRIARQAGAALIVGGRSAPRLRNLRDVAVANGASMVELTAFARGVVARVAEFHGR